MGNILGHAKKDTSYEQIHTKLLPEAAVFVFSMSMLLVKRVLPGVNIPPG